jgi:hypothetical protein
MSSSLSKSTPKAKPMRGGPQARCPLPLHNSMAGASNDQELAASMTPAAKPRAVKHLLARVLCREYAGCAHGNHEPRETGCQEGLQNRVEIFNQMYHKRSESLYRSTPEWELLACFRPEGLESASGCAEYTKPGEACQSKKIQKRSNAFLTRISGFLSK